MKAGALLSLLNGVDFKIQHFDLAALVAKVKNKEISKEQMTKLKDDVYNLSEDLLMIDCEK